jgi:hypothetical protein
MLLHQGKCNSPVFLRYFPNGTAGSLKHAFVCAEEANQESDNSSLSV